MKHTFIKYFYRSALYGVFIMHGEFPFGLYPLMIDADTLQVPFIQAVNTFVYFYFMVPSRLCSLLTSVSLRSVPSGFDASQRSSPLKPISFMIFSATSRIDTSLPVPTLMWQLRISVIPSAFFFDASYVCLKSTFSNTCTLHPPFLHSTKTHASAFPYPKA